ncbi:MAG: DUF4390 domain-containing protein [Formosimonas sp.]
MMLFNRCLFAALRRPVACVLLLLAVWVGSAHAAIVTQYATMTRLSDGAYAVNADFRFSLPNQLQDAVNHGTALYFTVDYQLARPRWYWTDEAVVSAQREYRISYNSLTQQYRVAVGSDQYRFNTLSESILFASRSSQWRVLGSSQYTSGEQYEASVRMMLNTSKLPRTYQLNSLTQQGWGLSSGWYRFSFTPR